MTTHRAVDRPAGRGRATHAASADAVAPASLWRDPLVLTGVVAVAVATGVRVLFLSRTWFWFDDLMLINVPARDGLDAAGLFEPYLSHLMPGGKLLAWLVTVGGPYQYSVAIAQIAILNAAAGLALLHLLITLFGRRKAILLPLVYFLMSPFLTTAVSWWCVGINHLPALAATCMALAAVVRHLRGGGNRPLVASMLWIVAGLFFAELTLYAYLPMLVIALGYFASGPLSARVGHVWQTHRSAVVGHGLLGLAYLAVFYQVAWDSVPSHDRPDWSAFITNASVTLFPSVSIGGPGHWHMAWEAQFEVAPTALTRLAGIVIVAGVVSLSALTRDRAMRAWLIPLSQLALSIALVGRARALFGPGIALDVRFFTPVALGMALALALAFLPVLGATESSTFRSSHWLVDSPVPAVVALTAYVALAVGTASAYPLLHLGDRDPKPWYAAVERSLAEHDGPVDLVDTNVPSAFLGPPQSAYSVALAGLRDRFRVPTVVQDDFYVFDDDGKLVRPDLAPVRNALTPAPSDCGYQVGTERTIPLDGPVIGFGWRVRLIYEAKADTTATIALGSGETGTVTDVQLLAGEHVLELPGDAEYEAVAVKDVDPGAGLCISSVVVGTTEIPGRPVP